MQAEEVTVLIFSMVIFAGAGLMVASMWTRRRMREMTHRERLAMIDRGLIPSPEGDPIRLDPPPRPVVRYDTERGVRFRSAGVLMVGLGFGLMVLIAFAAHSIETAIGVGGAFVALGFASLLNYTLLSRRTDDPFTRWPAPPPPPPRGPENSNPGL